MSQYKITKKRLAEIIKEEYEAAMERTDEAHCGTPNRDEKKPDEDGDGVPDWADKKPGEDDHADKKKMKKESLDSIRALIQQELKNL
jgi:hypothetical protein